MTHPQDLIHPYVYNAEMEGGLIADCISADAIVSADALIEALNKQEVKP